MSVRETLAGRAVHARMGAWQFPVVVSVLALVTTALPYLAGNRFTPPNRQFMGIVFDVPDTTQYFAWMRASARTTGLFIANPLTPEPNHAVFFNLLWFGLGHLGQFLHVDPLTVYQGFRWVAGAVFLGAFWVICVSFCRPGRERQVAFALGIVGGGFGWVWVLLKHVAHRSVPPLDIYIGEPNTIFSLMAFPHLLIGSALLIGIFLLYLRGAETHRWPPIIGAAAFALVLGLTHAYDLLIVYMVIGGYVLVVGLRRRALPWQLLMGGALIAVISSPPALYFTYLTQKDATWSGVLAQYGNGQIVTPTPPHLAILLGPVFLVALVAFFVPSARHAFWRGPERDLLPAVWFLGSFALVYLPTSYQIKMLNGWQIPASILAARALIRVFTPGIARALTSGRYGTPQVRIELLAGVALIVLALPTNLYLIGWRADELHRATPPFSITADDHAALQWLDTHSTPDDVVLASQTIGQFVASESDARPVLAHWAQTLQYYEKDAAVQRFYNATTPEDVRRTLLTTWHVHYVFAGPEERSLGQFDPATSPFYESVFTSGATTIYAVHLSPNGDERT